MMRYILLLATVLPLAAQDPTALWKAVLQPAFDPDKAAPVQNLSLTRDRLRLTLTQGTIQFTSPQNGLVFGAAFEGRGRLQLQPPAGPESQQLRLFTGKDALDAEFTEAVFHFGDATYDELAPQLRFAPATGPRLARLYQDRRHEHEELGDALAFCSPPTASVPPTSPPRSRPPTTAGSKSSSTPSNPKSSSPAAGLLPSPVVSSTLIPGSASPPATVPPPTPSDSPLPKKTSSSAITGSRLPSPNPPSCAPMPASTSSSRPRASAPSCSSWIPTSA